MLASILFRVPLVLLPLVDLPAPTRDCLIEPQSYHAADDLALARFDRAVRHYMEVRRRLERPMSPVWMSSDPELRRAAAEALAEELEYRLVGSSLVLLDVTADLVVDILPDALPLR
jgi:hypothetical protein